MHSFFRACTKRMALFSAFAVLIFAFSFAAMHASGRFTANVADPAPAATPEPGSLALLGTSLLGGAGVIFRRLHRASC